jgi:hypothetical protein
MRHERGEARSVVKPVELVQFADDSPQRGYQALASAILVREEPNPWCILASRHSPEVSFAPFLEHGSVARTVTCSPAAPKLETALQRDVPGSPHGLA